MSYEPPGLPSVDNASGPAIRPLPEMLLQFFIPRLEDKPQNPIMDTLRILHRPHPAPNVDAISPVRPNWPPSSRDMQTEPASKECLDTIWALAVAQRDRHHNQVLSWDALHPSSDISVVSSPFLSEQGSHTFASTRYHARPPIQDPDKRLVYIRLPDLFQSLLLTISGTSSPLYIWDPVFQRFDLRNLEGKKRGEVVIVGRDEVVSTSFLKRFLTIGNLMRRLELLTDMQAPRYTNSHITPVIHAFTHSLSSILVWLRHTAEVFFVATHGGTEGRLTAFWTQYETMESILQALASLCGRDEDVAPLDYTPLPTASTHLLSLIYNHLNDHLERSSPHGVSAILAFLLTTTSRGYLKSLGASVGYNTVATFLQPHLTYNPPTRQGVDLMEEDRHDDQAEAGKDEHGTEAESYPGFVTPEVAEIISRAHKSLVLLRAADPGHPLLTSTHMHPDIEWVWTAEQLDNLENQLLFGGLTMSTRTKPLLDQNQVASRPDPSSSASVMDTFMVFDRAPGEFSTKSSSACESRLFSGASSMSPLRKFIADFPPSLPSSTPTLPHLTARVLAPLVAHAQSLSGALVTHFLSPSTPLHLHTHLELLRGYLLLTAHAFKARLKDALFTDAEDVSTPVAGSRTYAAREAREEQARRRSRSTPAVKSKGKMGKRVIGLSSALIVGDAWPPLDSDLNFLLRTVVLDALEEGRHRDEGKEDEGDGPGQEVGRAQRQIVEEAGWRLGFSTRDLPSGTGKEKWLNPLSIEALDFLYMQYKPPYPLDVLITPVILSKYHRMFAFNLRLMRVESVVHTLFRMTRKASAPLFSTLTPSNKLLLHFRFVAHTFLMTLSSYVYDIAIGSNIDRFLALLAGSSEPGPSFGESSRHRSTQPSNTNAFPDVFGLTEHHSRVLDDVLSSCLLRSGQKAVGDLLRGCMELVLELGVLAGELKDGNLEEYEAAPMLERLWSRFRDKMTTFVKVLKVLVEKEADSAGVVLSDIPLHMMQGHQRISGTTAHLHQLLIRLDLSDWWTGTVTR